MLLARVSHVFVVGSNTGLIVIRVKLADWLPTPFASFPFTSPPVRPGVPSDSLSTSTSVKYDLRITYDSNIRTTEWDLFLFCGQN
jgi:hypothetical protein